eukprot:scaffold192145_cov18-Tisochrysis_lutea.AAC.3
MHGNATVHTKGKYKHSVCTILNTGNTNVHTWGTHLHTRAASMARAERFPPTHLNPLEQKGGLACHGVLAADFRQVKGDPVL